MPRPKSLGSYAKLSSSYYRDDAILEAGERAEILFVRGLAYCSESPSDGFISDRQLRAVIGVGMRDVVKRASALVSAGLWQREEGGYLVRSWLKWHKSAEEIGQYLKADRERKARKAAGIQEDSERIPAGIQTDSGDQLSTDAVQDSSSQGTNTPSAGEHAQDPLDLDGLLVTPDGATESVKSMTVGQQFDAFWDVYPRKVGKDDARKVWDRKRKQVGAQMILDGARRLAADPNLPEDKTFIPHPATWLARGGWDDEPLPDRSASNRPTSSVANGYSDHWSNPDAGFFPNGKASA